MEFIISFLTFFISLPFLAFAVVYFLIKWLHKDKKKASSTAITVTTFCLFLSVTVMFKEIANFNTGIFIPILLLIIFIIAIVGLQWNVKGNIDINKALKGSFRLWFIALAVCYLLLFILGIIRFSI
ncbi:DUF3397 family protein [Desulfuribacillus alkaliarsenatis]|uniref:DUF3397 domain-containing protein n=1 Tax=Desulfuribacillus alkaliarsenatis TaxID=766136 RepID=A0A1E5FZR9_9FIRM|nr:DUF3397 family protein [Desulfuribacillus alkaliarsenatis]OEF96085.1 hypothetical protein BHF68_10130 [Desulfuribacillus alkaliarsenatis]